MNSISRLFTAILMTLGLLSACSVHEFPAADIEHDVVLELEFEKDLPIYKTVEVDTKSLPTPWTKVSENKSDYNLRHVVQIYRAGINGKFDRTVYRRMTFLRDDVGLDKDRLEFTLPVGTYKFIVWTDNVPKNGGKDAPDYFYNTSQFEEIILQNHVGSNDLRDAFRGSVDSDIKSGVETLVRMGMERPMARFSFVATDFEEFRTKVLTLLAAKAEASKSVSDTDTKAPDTKVIDLEDFKIVFNYTGFMPSSYNLYTMKPADATTGNFFETRMSQIDENNAELGFDYVFVNGDNASVSVSISAYDMDGNLMSKSKPFEVPLMRSRHTVVKGKFLTTMSSGAVGIDPSFDDEFNIEIK